MTEVPSRVDTYGSEDSEDWREIHREEEGDVPANPAAPYRPPTIPVGLPHVVKFATESGDLPWKERSIVILLSKPKPKWDVHLTEARNRAGSLSGVIRPLIAGPSGSAVSPRLSA